MSDDSNETAVDAASAFMNADVFYESEPEKPTEAGENPEVEDETSDDETSEAEIETEEQEEEVESTRYVFDEESGEYTFKAGGKDVNANTDQLIELASKGVGFEKKTTQAKRNEQQRSKEHAEALEGVKQSQTDLEGLIQGLEGLLQEEQISDDLLDSDPSEYIRQQKRSDERKNKITEARDKLVATKKLELGKVASEEFAKLRDVMEWETQEDVTEGFSLINDYCVGIGMSKEDIKDVYNHKIYVALNDAAKYRALEAKKKTVVKEVKSAPKSVKSKKPAQPAKDERSAVDVLYGS